MVSQMSKLPVKVALCAENIVEASSTNGAPMSEAVPFRNPKSAFPLRGFGTFAETPKVYDFHGMPHQSWRSDAHTDTSTVSPCISLDSLPSNEELSCDEFSEDSVAGATTPPPFPSWSLPAQSMPMLSIPRVLPTPRPAIASSFSCNQANATADNGTGLKVFAMKMLLSCREAGCIIGENGQQIQQIQTQTGTKMHLSSRNVFYPGTSLQELNIQGPSSAAVVAALQRTLEAIVSQRGIVSCGEPNVSIGKARMKTVVPILVAQSLASGVAEDILSLTGVRLEAKHEQEETILRLSGSLVGVTAAIIMVAQHLSSYMREPWFPEWAAYSKTARIPGSHSQQTDLVDEAVVVHDRRAHNIVPPMRGQQRLGTLKDSELGQQSQIRLPHPPSRCNLPDRKSSQFSCHKTLEEVAYAVPQSTPAKLVVDAASGRLVMMCGQTRI